ncbi:MAG: class I SAM-dependent methyltransferase [Bdellovibrionales bacterium]|nr:class I SAM-dependent methyltransferase [Bdellovibrionales bacterium]
MCPLCLATDAQELRADNKLYWHCNVCDLRFLDSKERLTPPEELERYHLHEPGDEGYLKFVSPLIHSVQTQVRNGARGLDFGAGRYPVLAQHLESLGYKIQIYDPYFWPQAIEGPFDFVTTCEVVEHLYSPHEEFIRLSGYLKTNGLLSIMTDLIKPETDFANWYYRRDPTHVVFYSAQSFQWIEKHLGFKELHVQGRLVTLRKA